MNEYLTQNELDLLFLQARNDQRAKQFREQNEEIRKLLEETDKILNWRHNNDE